MPTPDVDIDFFDRNIALQDLSHIPASIIKKDITKHNTGVYFQDIPIDPITELASLDHDLAEELGYFKIDFLNLKVYEKVKDEEHLNDLMNKDPLWDMLTEKSIVDTLFHLNGNFDIVSKMKPKSIYELAVVLAIKLPCKRYLLNKSPQKIEEDIWLSDKDGYYLKKPHAIAYAHVVVVQMNLMVESLESTAVSGE